MIPGMHSELQRFPNEMRTVIANSADYLIAPLLAITAFVISSSNSPKIRTCPSLRAWPISMRCAAFMNRRRWALAEDEWTEPS